MGTTALLASDSSFRRLWYRDRLPHFGIDVEIAESGVECLNLIHSCRPDIVILETSLLWGGSEGVLAIRSEDTKLQAIPFVLVDIDGISPRTCRLARYQLQSFLVHTPSIEELVNTIHLIHFGILVNCIEDEDLVMCCSAHHRIDVSKHLLQ